MIIGDLIDALVEMIFTIIYSIFSGICVLIDFIKNIFFKLSGIEPVIIDGEEGDLLTNLITSDGVKKAFLTITIIGVILLVVFTIIAIIKSNYQEKQNVKTVLSKSFSAFLVMVILPLTVFAGILLANTVMRAINQAMQVNLTGGNGSIGGHFLTTIGFNSYKGFEDKALIESKFISGELSYANISTVKKYYDITDLNYVIGLIGGLVMLVMFCLSAITFVQRIFDIILLYIISPISTSTMPLDESNRFKVWKDMLISKILSAYGIILVMNLFFLIIPYVYNIKFFDNGFENGIVLILFLIGGSFAVTKASRVIAQLCGGQASGGEMAQMLYNIRSGIALARATKHLSHAVVGGVVGGSDYKALRKSGKTRGEAVNASIHSNRNQRVIDGTKKNSKVKQVLGMPLRLASMPAGMLHDFARGGVIQVGKNFIPRCKNVGVGNSLFNHADIKPKAKNSEKKEEPNNTELNKSNANVNNVADNIKPDNNMETARANDSNNSTQDSVDDKETNTVSERNNSEESHNNDSNILDGGNKTSENNTEDVKD